MSRKNRRLGRHKEQHSTRQIGEFLPRPRKSRLETWAVRHSTRTVCCCPFHFSHKTRGRGGAQRHHQTISWTTAHRQAGSVHRTWRGGHRPSPPLTTERYSGVGFDCSNAHTCGQARIIGSRVITAADSSQSLFTPLSGLRDILYS